MGGGLTVPEDGLILVAGHAFADFVAVAKVELGGGIAVAGGAFVPANGFGEILGDALAAMVEDAKCEFGVGVALFRGGANPVGGHGVVLFGAFAGGVTKAKFKLGGGVAGFGELMEFFLGFGKRSSGRGGVCRGGGCRCLGRSGGRRGSWGRRGSRFGCRGGEFGRGLEADGFLRRRLGGGWCGLRFGRGGRGLGGLSFQILVSLAGVFVALGGCFGVPIEGLVEVGLHAFAGFVAVAKIELGSGVALIGGLAVPRDGLCEVEGDAAAFLIEGAEDKLSVNEPGGGGFFEPAGGGREVLTNAFTLGQEDPDFVLCGRVTFGRLGEKRLQIGIAHRAGRLVAGQGRIQLLIG